MSGGASDWERSGGGGMQELDWEAVETDVGKVVGTETQSNGNSVRCAIFRPMGKILEAGYIKMQLYLSAPETRGGCTRLFHFSGTPL